VLKKIKKVPNMKEVHEVAYHQNKLYEKQRLK